MAATAARAATASGRAGGTAAASSAASAMISVICDAITATNPNNKPGLTDTSVKMGSEAPASNDDRDAHESGREALPNTVCNLNNALNKTSSQSPSDRHAWEGVSEYRG